MPCKKESLVSSSLKYRVSRIPGGIWSDDECFKEIDADQNFYIDGLDRLVIVFDEYEVAPGSMGMPEFAIAPELLEEILLQPSVIG